MEIKVYLYTILKKYGEGKIDADNTVRLAKPLSLKELSAYFNFPKKPSQIFLVNNAPRPQGYIVKDGDIVKIWGFICGG
jgi:hypothetical protein